MNTFKTGLTRLGAYLLLGGILTVPISCDRDKENSVKPTEAISRAKRVGDPGCDASSFVTGKFLGTWTVTGSRLQVLVNPDDQKIYVIQILDGNEFYVRGKAFLERTDIANKPNINLDCFEGDPGDAQGFGVSNFQPSSIFEPGNIQFAYRTKCSPRFSTGDILSRIYIATWATPNTRLEARKINGLWWITQNVTDAAGVGRDAFVFRGTNILLRSDVNNFFDPYDIGRRYCFSNGETNIGLAEPDNSPRQIDQYTRTTLGDGTPCFVRNN